MFAEASASGVELPTPKDMNAELIDRAMSDEIIKTGFHSIDARVGPLYRGDMFVIGGAAKAGKSLLATSIAMRIAQMHPVLIFSAEMSRAEIWKRVIAAESEVGTSYWQPEKNSSQGQITAVTQAMRRLMSLKITIVHDVIDIEEAIGVAQMWKLKQGGLGAVVFDYIQLFSTQHVKRGSRAEYVAHISREIKRAATRLQCLCIALSQLNEDGFSLESRGIQRDCNLMLNVEADEKGDDRTVTCAYNRSGPMRVVLPLKADVYHCRFTE